MYKILGGDGKEYGPIPAETLKQWVAEGRANAQTQVQAEGATGWTALGELAEFATVFGQPAAPTPIAPARTTSSAPLQMVQGPAIGLIVTAGLGALGQIAGLLFGVLGTGLGMAGAAARGEQELPQWAHLMSGGVGVVFNIIAIAMSVVLLLGALKMMKLQNYSFALTATIIAMVPCVSPCCWIGLPIGIWALVVLMKPEVKGSFS